MSHSLTIGTLLTGDPGADATLLASKFNRHTFWCGQSGSGKTYALGVVLERLLIETRLPMVILDPNSDFVRMKEVQDSAHPDIAAELGNRSIRVLGKGGDEPLKVRFLELQARTRAAVMQIDPILEAEQFNTSLRIGAELGGRVPDTPMQGRLIEWLRAHPDPLRRQFGIRLENLGIADWDLWAWGARDIDDVLDEHHDATILDLGSLSEPGEAKAAALSVLQHLWEQRDRRQPRLIVIDEAHNLCPPDPQSPIDRMLADQIIQIAAEGRKFGLWLVLSTQRPAKLHINALSQCDNIALMRMNAPNDLRVLGDTFGFIPSELLEQAASFSQGQAIFAGGFIADASIIQMGERLTAEGGRDVPVPLR
jgi:DNA helicase HerA-like ATPase